PGSGGPRRPCIAEPFVPAVFSALHSPSPEALDQPNRTPHPGNHSKHQQFSSSFHPSTFRLTNAYFLLQNHRVARNHFVIQSIRSPPEPAGNAAGGERTGPGSGGEPSRGTSRPNFRRVGCTLDRATSAARCPDSVR